LFLLFNYLNDARSYEDNTNSPVMSYFLVCVLQECECHFNMCTATNDTNIDYHCVQTWKCESSSFSCNFSVL